jgi:beta-glucosidase
MRDQLGDRLPEFTPEESALLKGSNDFYGMNHYCANYVKHRPASEPVDPNDWMGHLESLQENKAGEAIGPKTESFWLQPNAPGFRHLLNWISDRYGRPKIYVTENGTSILDETDLPKEKLLEDDFRVWYFDTYVKAMAEAVAIDGVDVRAYMGWSLMDNFEWVRVSPPHSPKFC